MPEQKHTRKIEKWSEIINNLGLDLSRPINRVTARQIKQIVNEEPRLMAKMDSMADLPRIFRENNLFLLPVSRQEYVIVKGNGYHELEKIAEKPTLYPTSYPFPTSALDVKSEGIYLDYAHSCGLISDFVTLSNLHLSFRGRRTTPSFRFDVNGSQIQVNSAQIEVDAVYENVDKIVTVEAKVGIPDSFSVRQVYYPFRTFNTKKPVRNIFFCFEPNEKIYLLWEYEFNPQTVFESIKLLQSKQYKIKLADIVSVKEYQDVKPTKKLDIPQADDVNKIIQFPFRVFEGYDTSEKMIDAFGFVQRQSSYYRQAAELVGLVKLDKNRYKLTDVGEKYLKLPEKDKSNFVCKLLLEFPIMHEIFLQISIDSKKVVDKNEIIDLLRERSSITGSTLGRRAQTIVSWFRWIRNNLGIVEVDKDKIRIARQMRIA
ncbi:MAG: hypothetical protein DA330_04780 [Nitrososphaera sp.]|nr:hypothetical protein [Nitrososphaera sp.]